MAFLRFGTNNSGGVNSVNASTAQLLPATSPKDSKQGRKEAQRLAKEVEKETRRLHEQQLREQARAVMQKRRLRMEKEGPWQEGAISFAW